jgi:hypothetical protein
MDPLTKSKLDLSQEVIDKMHLSILTLPHRLFSSNMLLRSATADIGAAFLNPDLGKDVIHMKLDR